VGARPEDLEATWRSIRHAATVLLVRPGADGRPEFYFLRRPDTMRAFAGVWAFAGGSVEPGDRALAADWIDPGRATALAEAWEKDPASVEMERFLAWAAPRFRERSGRVPEAVVPPLGFDPPANAAVWVTAVRELYEETGIWLGDGAIPAAFDRLGAAELAPAVGRLRFLGRLVTPSHQPVRFNTRFFLARLEAGDEPAADGADRDREVAATTWRPAAEALAAQAAGAFPMAFPTRFVLERLAPYATVDALWAAYGGRRLD
jgi:8-oxo-dGTP pyrophosphatase MutT (NUDIX family)